MATDKEKLKKFDKAKKHVDDTMSELKEQNKEFKDGLDDLRPEEKALWDENKLRLEVFEEVEAQWQ